MASEITLKRNSATCSARSGLRLSIGWLLPTLAEGRQASMSIQRHPQLAAQGGSMLVDSRCPPTTALARRHNPPTPSPKRRRAADHAALAAATATASGRPPIRGARSPTATQNRLNPTANSSARQANRRRQSRTVVCAKPNPPADRRIPTPPHIVSSAEPITSTASRRPQVKNPGTKACVPHSTGPGAPTAGGSPRRSPARRAHTIPKNGIGWRHRGQSSRGTTTSTRRHVHVDIQLGWPYDRHRHTAAGPFR